MSFIQDFKIKIFSNAPVSNIKEGGCEDTSPPVPTPMVIRVDINTAVTKKVLQLCYFVKSADVY